MTAQIVTRCEVNMSAEEQKMLEKVVDWIDQQFVEGDADEMPEGIQEILNSIHEEISHLLSLIPEEH